MSDFEENGVVYFIANGRTVKKAYVAEEGEMYSLRCEGHDGGVAGIRLRKNRIYKTKEAAEAAVKKPCHR